MILAKSFAEVGVHDELVAFAERDVGLHRRAQLVVGHQLVHGFANRRLQRFLVQGRAMHLAHEVRGDLAGAEAGVQPPPSA